MLDNVNGGSTEAIAKLINLSKRATRSRMLALIEIGLIVEIGLGLKDLHKKYFLTNKKIARGDFG